MGRHAFFRNHLLAIAVVVTIVGLVPTVVAYLVADYGGVSPGPSWYTDLVPNDGWNLWVKIVAPLVLLTGLWYLGEQLLLRRKLHRLVDTGKRSDLVRNMSQIEGILGRLPRSFEKRVQEKEGAIKSKR
jgi:hypothetical protein